MTKTADLEKEPENFSNWRKSNALLLVTIAVAIFLDNILVSAVVPILPQYLRDLEHANTISKTVELANATIRSPNRTQSAHYSYFGSNNVTTERATNNYTDNTVSAQAAAKNESLSKEGTKFGFLLASKPFVQLIVNPFVGSIVYRFGYRRVMFIGFIILFSSTLLFAYGETYEILFFARSMQGLASSCTSVTGMATLAKRYTVDAERVDAMRIALGGIALGLSVGPPFGGATYQYFGKRSPFLILCGLTLIDGFLLSIILEPKINRKNGEVKQTSFFTLLRDPYILIAAGGIFILCAVYSTAEVALPLWMMDTMGSTRLQVGLAFTPSPIGFFLVMNVLGKWCMRLKRWLLIIIGTIFSGTCLLLYPLCRSIEHVILPSFMMGTGAAMMELALMPEFAHLMDIRHTPEYGNAYAISDVAVCLGLCIAPSGAGFIFEKFGFGIVMVGGGIICFLYIPLAYLLKNPTIRNKQPDSAEAPTTDKLLRDKQ